MKKKLLKLANEIIDDSTIPGRTSDDFEEIARELAFEVKNFIRALEPQVFELTKQQQEIQLWEDLQLNCDDG